ncbi:leucine-rich repeat domain-containing protein [Desulfopila aestuarii]|uniref:Disease resistance R13L4/SHOC-2-like LRR domain-containing protein n=1 Tax=Desulfopila aestuarii DSM 18488 TaxID=1121416 RepID=A0A1M7YFH5_9BACT|nr:hypothetical protein [Desulfopila aestuarii]SHO51395.1 hypothetical protein SAMN02745220_03983 [Desulfopila aestuarii DSM 18488]
MRKNYKGFPNEAFTEDEIAAGIHHAVRDGYFPGDKEQISKEAVKQQLYFTTFKEATEWAKNNPGKAIVRSPNGRGFVEKDDSDSNIITKISIYGDNITTCNYMLNNAIARNVKTIYADNCSEEILRNIFKKFIHLERLQIQSYVSDDLPGEISNLTKLKHLSIINWAAIKIPEKICRVKNLEELFIINQPPFDNDIILPKTIHTLTKLRKLELDPSQAISYIPYSIGKLENLEDLSIFNCDIIPTEIRNLSNLKKMTITSRNGNIPSDIYNLSNLENLSLMHLNYLSQDIVKLRNLKVLDLTYARFAELPKEIYTLHDIEELYLAGSNLVTLPIDVLKLKMLKLLNLDYCCELLSIPYELFDIPNIELHLSGNYKLAENMLDVDIMEYIQADFLYDI